MNARAICLCCFLIFGTIWPAHATQKMTITVSPSVAFAPAHLVIRTRIEADAGNRAIEVVADSTDYYRSTVIELDGDRSPVSSIIDFRSVPPGDYDVSATLFGPAGEMLAHERRTIKVLSGDEQ